MIRNEDIIAFIRSRGPVIPLEVAKLIGTNIMFASAHLSELASKGLVKISSVKVGGSPLYYLPGQEARLQEYKDRLPEKERKAFELLREQKLLKDSELPPVVRFALRQIKDFAKPIEISGNLFWRWYLSTPDETQNYYRTRFESKPQESPMKTPGPDKPITPAPQFTQEKPKKLETAGVQSTIRAASHENTNKPHSPAKDIISRVRQYFQANNIEILQEHPLKKGRQTGFIVKVPSAIGPIKYYAEVKSKKRITEADLSEAFVRSESKKLPLIFLTDGKLVKTTLEGVFNGIIIKQI